MSRRVWVPNGRQTTVNPKRITAALDLAGLEGPGVDRALGGQEPLVDEWEAGTRTPTDGQLQALADLCGVPVAFFYQQDPPNVGPIVMCESDGCHVVQREPHPSDPPADVIPLFGQRTLL